MRSRGMERERERASMAKTATEDQAAAGQGEPITSATAVGPGGPPAPRPKRRRRLRWVLFGLAILVAAGVALYLHLAGWESTDDAQIDGYIYPVSSRVSGYVTRVTVEDNQFVNAGTVLTELDRKDYVVAVANAKGNLANAQHNAASQVINVPITTVNTSTQVSTSQAEVENAKAGFRAAQRDWDAAKASLQEAIANDRKARDDVTRYRLLAAKEEISQQTYVQAVHTQEGTAAAVASARASAESREHAVTQAAARLEQAQAQERSADVTKPEQISAQRSRARAAQGQTDSAAAALRQAELNLQYTTILAPVSGLVGQRSAQPGQYIAPGQQLMTVVPLDTENIWVTANFKETQLKYMRPGQPVIISVDTYGRKYNGHVLNIAGATGARFSILPPENATGNYVKVVQRIPVKIVFEKGQDPEHLLRLGMSVEPKVKVR
jgi:membrane fusion protein, multidrug efflux system